MVIIVIWLSLTPKPPQPPSILGWDKAQHLLAYSSLMAWFAMSFVRHWRWPVFLLGLGIGLECLQGISGFRRFDIFDIAANSAGVCLGIALAKTRLGQTLTVIDTLLIKRMALGSLI